MIDCHDSMSKNETRILITGGSGFIGTNAVEHFLKLGYSVLNLDKKPPQNKAHLSLWSEVDILDAVKLRKAILGFQPQYLLHLAARTDLGEKKRLDGYAANIDGVKNVITAIKGCPSLRRIIIASSRMVCKIGYQPTSEEDYCPPNLYGQSKVITEQLIRNAELACEWIIVRPTSIWGPWFHVPYKIYFETISKRIYFNISGFNPIKSFGFVGNTIYQLERLFLSQSNKVDRRTLYLTDYPPIRVNEWSEIIRIRMKRPLISTIPYFVAKIGAICGDIVTPIFGNFPLTSFRLDNLLTDMVYDTTELESLCGPLPFKLEEGVNLTVDWMDADKKEI